MENRTVLFLYPELNSVDDAEQNAIIRIISDLKLVINGANRQIKKILQQEGNFSYIRCLPNIEMEEANKHPFGQNIEFVRVCVIGHNNKNYENSYNDICTKYANNTLDISHLIGLRINSDLENVCFSKPNESPFDVIVESNIEDLVALLISIMLDTSLYHYFSLNNDIKYRKKFSEIKMDCIKKDMKIEDYGQVIDSTSIKYLPFSYPYIKQYSLSIENQQDSSAEMIINSLIKQYFLFIKNYACTHLEYNAKKEAKNPYIKMSTNLKSALDKIVKTLDSSVDNNYILAIHNGIEKSKNPSLNSDYFMLIDDDNIITNWLSSFTVPLNEFTLFHLKIGD